MKKRIIEIIVNDEYVLGSGVVIGAAGSHDDVTLRIKFNDTWIGLSLYATFRNAKGENPTVVAMPATMLVDGETMTYDVDIPAAAKLYEGRATLALTGYTIVNGTQEDTATNTVTAFFRVLPSDFAFADDKSIDATLAQQLLTAIDNHVTDVNGRLDEQNGRINEVYGAFENGEFKGDAYVITEADKKEIAGISIEALKKEFGDTDAALDAILAIQNELMGGGEIEEITFTLNHRYTDTTDTLTARKGMTWREWCDSEYNTIGAYSLNDLNSTIILHDVEGGIHYIHYEYGTPDYIEVYTTDIIEEGHEYICPNWGV